ncbi:hypothetical protein TH61_06885 [Rufibacter sp. DG15C]|uniref:hypothetical protein n=1 Tax=Rufibacter sp. DG15C TaxID=1379909 RepID=UPI00078BECE8|nr:hypothetical protein [Rufibacter sp. DG15C]AMM50960.1 hypothetical protein TH61_06885 [Rufibacter sp. DG15C]
MTKKGQMIVTNIVIFAFLAGAFYLLVHYSETEIKKRIDTVNSDYTYSKGLIKDIKYYKGHSVDVKYRIGNKSYEFSGGWDDNPKHILEGDSIKFRYSIQSPDLIITELEDEY